MLRHGLPFSRLLVLLATLTTFAGCHTASRPPTRTAAAEPTSSRPAPVLAEGQTHQLSLDDALAYANEHSPSLQLEQVRAQRGDAEIEAASPAFPANPVVSVGLGGRIDTEGHHVEMLYGLEQSFEFAGERRLRTETAEIYRDALQARLATARWQLEQDVRCAFYGALLAREQLAAAERIVAFSEQVVAVTQRQVDADDISPLSLLVAQSELAQAQQARVEARSIVEQRRLEVAELIGLPDNVDFELVGSPCPARPAPDVDQLLEQALANHPELRARERVRDAAESRVRLEDREAFPEPSLGVSYAREGAEEDNPHLWLVTLGLPIPLWQRNQGDRARARVEADIARRDLELWQATLRQRLARAAQAVNAAAERVAIFGTDIVPTMERNLERIQRAYELGELNIHQVSQTRQRVLEGENAALAALNDYFHAASALQSLVGVEVWTDHDEASQAEAEEEE